MPSKESRYSDPLHDQSSVTGGESRRSKAIPESRSSTQLYQSDFFSRDPAVSNARNVYAKILVGGVAMIDIIIFTIFPILYGAFYKTPVSKISWTIVSAGIAVTINPGASTKLTAALEKPDSIYDGSQAISVFASEARNENAFRALLLHSVQNTLMAISIRFALQQAQAIANASVFPRLMETAPQTVLSPISFQLFNLHSFDQPLASVVVFVGLLFALILSFFVVMIQHGAREITNIRRLLKLRSLIMLRLTSSFIAYFFVSLFYSLLSLAFHLDFSKKFGPAGFFIYWMLNICGMCAMGLVLESMLTLLTLKLIPFFLLLWLMCTFLIEILPKFYRFGYALPFYHISKAVRTIVFGTKNQVGFDFGVLLIWSVLSCITLTLFEFGVRRKEVITARRKDVQAEKPKAGGA